MKALHQANCSTAQGSAGSMLWALHQAHPLDEHGMMRIARRNVTSSSHRSLSA